jgi:hypothetical protein
MKTKVLAAACGILLLPSGPARAQQANPEPRLRLSASVGGADLFRIEDRSYGRRPSIGGGVSLRLASKVWIDVELNRFLGLEATPAPCGLVDVTCIGSGREGYRAATIGSAGVTYHFGSDEAHAAVTGGIGYVRAHGFATTTFANTGQQVEQAITDDGWGPTIGVSVRVPLQSRWAIEPAFRVYGADGPNLSVIRGSFALTRDF